MDVHPPPMDVHFCGGIKCCYFIVFLKKHMTPGGSTQQFLKTMVTGDADTNWGRVRQLEAWCHREKPNAWIGDKRAPSTQGAVGSAGQ